MIYCSGNSIVIWKCVWRNLNSISWLFSVSWGFSIECLSYEWVIFLVILYRCYFHQTFFRWLWPLCRLCKFKNTDIFNLHKKRGVGLVDFKSFNQHQGLLCVTTCVPLSDDVITGYLYKSLTKSARIYWRRIFKLIPLTRSQSYQDLSLHILSIVVP